jgi:hypothetical protein
MQAHNRKDEKAARIRSFKMINWHVQVDKIEKKFATICAQAKEQGFFENLYVSRDDKHRQIQLFAGKHPVGTSEPTYDRYGKKAGCKLHAEGGAALVVSQASSGNVAVILYPFSSENHYRHVQSIILRIYRSPDQVTDAVLDAAIKDFFTYMRVSSTLFSKGLAARIRVQYLESRSKKYTDGRGFIKCLFPHWLRVVLGVLGSVASIYSFWK